MKAWIVGTKGRKPSKPIPTRPAAVEELMGRLPDPGAGMGPRGYEWKMRGSHRWFRAQNRPDLHRKIARLRFQLGDALWVRRTGRATIYVLRSVDYIAPTPTLPPYPYSVGTRGVRVLWDDIQLAVHEYRQKTGRRVRFVCQGVFNPRKIDGSNTWSQHAYGDPAGCGNAIDGHIVDEDGEFDREATTAIVNNVRSMGHASEVLWLVSGHYEHFHDTASPKLFGWPSCV
jgi:hypothetical protein